MLRRHHLYFNSGAETLFGWLHQPGDSDSSGIAALICNPLGVEYMSGHRSIRRLADRLAEAGIPALRFDYSCTGDSSGGEFRNTSVQQIVRDIRSAAATARELTGASQIVLLGIGLGATFAALAADSEDIGPMILWNPTANGRRFVREQKLLSAVLDDSQSSRSGAIDSAGIYLTSEMQDEIGGVNLTSLSWQRKHPVLLISRSDMDSQKKLIDTLSAKDFAFEHVALPGYREMMDQPTDTIVPVEVFEYLCNWLPDPTKVATSGHAAPSLPDRTRIHSDDVTAIELDEVASRFGTAQQLFGIASMPLNANPAATGKPAHVFINCGSEHHAGPHRMYTILSRRIAAQGGLAFRFDLEGIGDSVSIGNNEENNSYSPVAISDIDQALQFLTDKYGCESFILSGICAGAYHSFKATTELSERNILEANLINPLVFEWNYDDPDDHLKYEVHTYRVAIRHPRNWKRLVSGDIDYRRLVRSVIRHLSESVRRQIYRVTHALARTAPKGLPSDLRRLRELGRPLTLILSEGDPGLDIMKLQARRETRIGLAHGDIDVKKLVNSNHGLSKKHMQDQLITALMHKYFADSGQ